MLIEKRILFNTILHRNWIQEEQIHCEDENFKKITCPSEVAGLHTNQTPYFTNIYVISANVACPSDNTKWPDRSLH